MTYMPFASIENKATTFFQKLIGLEDHLPTRQTLTYKLQTLYEKTHNPVKVFVEPNRHFVRSITTDGWKASNGQSFYSFTLHLITADWKFNHLLVGLDHILVH